MFVTMQKHVQKGTKSSCKLQIPYPAGKITLVKLWTNVVNDLYDVESTFRNKIENENWFNVTFPTMKKH